MKTSSTFWSQLEADIEKYSNRAKKNIREYEKRQQKQTKNLKNRKNSDTSLAIRNHSVMSEKAPNSINQIRNQYRHSLQKQTQIKNKIHYMAIQRDRCLQSSELVKQKYQKVLSIRSESLREKKIINEELLNFQTGYYVMQKSKVLQVQKQKKSLQRSQKRLLNQKFSMAKSVRLATKKNQQTIEENKQKQLANKQQAVNTVQLAQQKSAQVLKKLSYRKIQIGKKNHQKKVWDQYKKLQLQNSRNNTIIDKFDTKMKEIQQQKVKAEQQINLYRNFLGLNRGRRINPEQSPSRNSHRSQKAGIFSPFYLTS